MKRRKAKADHQADTRGDAWVGLPKVVAKSAAYLSLSPFERAVFWIILEKFNGYNNGEIAISYEEIGQLLKGGNKSLPNNGRIGRAIATLVERGLLAEPTPGSWIQRLAREYRLTFITSGKCPPFTRASNEYLSWNPQAKKNGGDGASPKKSITGEGRSPELSAVDDARSPEKLKNDSFPSSENNRPGDAGSLLIDIPYRGLPTTALQSGSNDTTRDGVRDGCAR